MTNRFMPALFVCLILAGAASSQINSTRFRYVSIDVPGAVGTFPTGINNFGEIVGYYEVGSNCPIIPTCQIHGFKLVNQKFITTDIPGAVNTSLLGVNDGGDVAGSFATPDGITHGFLLHHTGQLQIIDRVGATFTTANGVNNSLTVVGNSDNTGSIKGFIWKNGKFTNFDIATPGTGESDELEAISNTGIIAGTIFRQDVFNGFQRTGTDIDVFLLSTDIHFHGVNSRDDLVGESGGRGFVVFHQEPSETNEKNEPVLKRLPIIFPGAKDTAAFSINYHQAIVGTFFGNDNRTHGFLAVH